jgi:putative MATE family efflux protein
MKNRGFSAPSARIRAPASGYDLTTGEIGAKLVRLSLPAIAGQLTQVLYGLADMAWLGRLENGAAGAVAASGSVATLMWLSFAFRAFGSAGAQIGVAQNLGGGRADIAREYARSAITLSAILGLFCGVSFALFRGTFVGFFGINDKAVYADAIAYLTLVSVGVPFAYVTETAAAVFSASGDSKTPFVINLACLAANAALDPILIFTLRMGVAGAALATSLCQAVSCAAMLLALKRFRREGLSGLRLFGLPKAPYLLQMLRWGAPPALEVSCFVFFVILVSRIVASFGAEAMAVQRIGNQIDQFSYLVAGGFGVALTAFVGQNHGAGHVGRILVGVRISSVIMGAWGVATTLNLLLFNRLLFSIFVPREPAVIEMGAQYLRIFALCQFAACLEGVGSAVCRGLGRTLTASVNSISSSALRVLLALLLTRDEFGLRQNGVWLAIALSAFMRGAGVYILGLRHIFRLKAAAVIVGQRGSEPC